MENGSRSVSHTNHDRDQRPNGVNGATHMAEKDQEKGKGRTEPHQHVTPMSPTIPNGFNGNFIDSIQQETGKEGSVVQTAESRINELPPEIAHITGGYMPLSTLLSRLAQKTHAEISTMVRELGQMSVPTSAVNGNASHITTVDDNSIDNINKKLRMLKFAQDAHTEWTKALVITDWSRKSEDVGRMIDLNVHLSNQRRLYSYAVDTLSEHKRSYYQARLPNPDLKTALEVLTVGKASWMPDLGYIAPPPLTAKQVLEHLENLNTLLSIRMNLHEYDNLPYYFRDYSIKSGRATFKVAGEFEADLTIADEDPETQFWFIDFRFKFWPSPSDVPEQFRLHMEARVNEALHQEGLFGCYKYLHEMVLTHKITEYRRQASELARGKWVDGLKVEALNRTLSIQYWLDRYGKGPKSWILLGVHSGRPTHGRQDAKSTSRLAIRWFRDARELKDANIQFDTVNLSTEELLKGVIAKHINYILMSMFENLRSKPLFKDHDATISLSASPTEAAESELQVQLTHALRVSVRIEPVSGRFVFSPASPRVAEYEFNLNAQSQDPAADGHKFIEKLRSVSILDEILNLGISVGWKRANPGIRPDELKPVMPKETLQIGWFRRAGWAADWYMAVSLGMGGELWWLIETANGATGPRIANSINIPVKAVSPIPSYTFLLTLNVFAAALISHYSNLKALHARRALHMLRITNSPSKGVVLPAIYVRLSELLPSNNRSSRTGEPWAKDIVKLTFQGLEFMPQQQQDTGELLQVPAASPLQNAAGNMQPGLLQVPASSPNEVAVMVTVARMVLHLPKSLTNINEMVDHDIAFHPTSGSFAFRLRTAIGESVIPAFIERAVRVERLVEFVEAIQKHGQTLKCENVSIGKITFKYSNVPEAVTSAEAVPPNDSPRVYKAVVDFSAIHNSINLILERGNPHLRILDQLVKILNDKEGLDGVATLLPLTLPLLCAFDSMETAWTSLTEKDGIYIYTRAADWYVICYDMFHFASPGSNPTVSSRKFTFEIRMRQRKAVPWWYVRRTDIRERGGDYLDQALKPVWDSSGVGWQGMRVNGVAQPNGIGDLLGKMDEVMRNVASDPKSSDPLMIDSATLNSSANGQSANQSSNQRQQQASTSQIHNQSLGRSSAVKREIVEID